MATGLKRRGFLLALTAPAIIGIDKKLHVSQLWVPKPRFEMPVQLGYTIVGTDHEGKHVSEWIWIGAGSGMFSTLSQLRCKRIDHILIGRSVALECPAREHTEPRVVAWTRPASELLRQS